MDTLQDRASEELLLLKNVLARKPQKEQIELLETYARTAIVRQCAAAAESAALRAELHRIKARLAAASRRNEATVAAYRVSLDRILVETRAQCEQRLRAVTEELAQAKRSVSAREEERDLLFATTVEEMARLPPPPLLRAEAPDLAPLALALTEVGVRRTGRLRSSFEREAIFRDEEQACLAIRVLLRSVGLERLWTEWGPSSEAQVLSHQSDSPLSSGDRVLLLAAYDLWSGQGGLAFVEIIERLRGEPARALFTLAAATSISPTAVDQ